MKKKQKEKENGENEIEDETAKKYEDMEKKYGIKRTFPPRSLVETDP